MESPIWTPGITLPASAKALRIRWICGYPAHTRRPGPGRSWENQVPALVDAGHRVITYDRRGFGSSSQPWEGYGYDTFAADLHTLLEHLDLRSATLVGFSMGGRRRGRALHRDPRNRSRGEGRARDIAADASPKGTLDCIAAFGRTDFRGDLEKMTLPTLVIHGDSDGIVPFEVSGKRSHEAIADSELVVIEGAPHGCNATHAEAFNRALLEFLAR